MDLKRKILFIVTLTILFVSSCSTLQKLDRKVIDRDINMKCTEWIYYR